TNSPARTSIGSRSSFVSDDGSPAMNSSLVAAGQFLEDRLEALHGANVTNAGGLLFDAQHFGHFTVCQFLEMAPGQDLAIDRVHSLNRRFELPRQLVAHGDLAGRRQPVE